MTYETGSAIDLEDLLTKLDAFADTTHGGWTGDYTSNPDTTNGWFSLSKAASSINVTMKYPVGAQGPPTNMSLHQATAFVNNSTAPGKHTADSGNGYNTTDTGHTNANLESERCVREIGDGPFQTYHFFADDTAPNDYIHVAVEAVPGMYRHFGFGANLVDGNGNANFGDNWTGGQYLYGHYHDNGTGANAVDPNHQVLFDGLGSTGERLRAATIRIASGLANQGAAVWGVTCALPSASLLTDTAGNIRQQIHGGYRAGMEARGFGNPVGNFSSGVVSMYSISAWYRDPNNARVYLLGYIPDVRAFNTRNFDPAQEITIGSDTWVMFPMSIKTVQAVANRSLYSGIAYKKVV